MLTIGQAVLATAVMALATMICRAAPFLFFRSAGGRRRALFIGFVERAVPPVAMTVLAVTAVAAAVKPVAPFGLPALAAAGFTALVHLWKRNALISIVGGTALYMLLIRAVGA